MGWHTMAKLPLAFSLRSRDDRHGQRFARGRPPMTSGFHALRAIPIAPLALVLTSGLLACGGLRDGDSPAGSGNGAIDAVTALADASGASSACSHYYAAQYTRCGGPLPPANQEARFVQVCLGDMALPGSGMSPPAVEACASALDASPCELPNGAPSECNFKGSLPGGAPCNQGAQCQNGVCQGTVAYSPGGQEGPFTCGTCAPIATVGQTCAHDDFSASCVGNALCLITPATATASDATYTCVATVEGDVGAACDDLSATCKTGLYCASQTGQCAVLGEAGATCGEGASRPSGDPGGCAAPLSCVGLPGAATCDAGAEGAFCLLDADCHQGLGCLPGPCSSTEGRIGCAASGTCAPVAWAAAGQPCDGYQTRCAVGSCNTDLANGTQGTCPTVVPDGQACTVQGVGPVAHGPTCDAFSECFRAAGPAGTNAPGTCVPIDSTVCR
jgi:hypothetical protein